MQRKTPSRNIAARAGRWSAQHRKTAIFGWLAFVLIALVAGSAAGHASRTRQQQRPRRVRPRRRRHSSAPSRQDEADEQVLVQKKGGRRLRRPVPHRGRRGTSRKLEATSTYATSPRRSTAVTTASSRPTAARRWSTFKLAGRRGGDREERRGAARDRRVAAEGQPRAARRGVRRRQRRQGAHRRPRARTSSGPRRCRSRSPCSSSSIAFGAIVAAGIPVILALSAVAGTMGLVNLVSQVTAAGPTASRR